ncbi:MAG: EamA family transporter, partial [Oscillospiraceae bacterium]|nr:EamA family transporter [Oscillospiraceae bacterium]
VSSPICNCSGAFAAVLCFIFLAEPIGLLQGIGTVLITVGMFIMGVAERNEDEEARRARQALSGRSYKKSWLGMLLPISYCILDTLGTFADSAILETLDENVANVAYELTFLLCGIVAFIIVLSKKQRFTVKADAPKFVGAVCETIGQVFYIQALAANPTAAAPLICSYCMLSCVWAAIFLKERLSKRHYLALLFAFAGIIVLGFCE